MPARPALLIVLLCATSLASPAQAPGGKSAEVQEHERLARQYLGEQRPELAIGELRKIVDLDPGNVEARANLGVLLFFQGHYQDAMPQLEAAIRLQPNLPKVRSLLGFAEQRTGSLAAARKDLEASFPLIEERKLKIEVGLDLVGLYTDTSELEKAGRVVSELKAAYPDAPEVLYAAYRTYADLSGEAMLSLSMVAPNSAQMHQVLAHEETREGNTNGAIRQYQKAIAINPHLPGVHFELAELLNTSEDPAVKKEAEHQFRVAIEENPQDVKSLSALAEMADAGGDTKQALDDYSRAVALKPLDADAKLGLAKVLIEMDRREQALSLLETSAQLEPTNATAHYRLATLYRRMGRMEDAKREVGLYQQYRDMKDKLRATYKELLVQPDEIRASEDSDREPRGGK